jgi:hypothetical protein
MTNFMTLKAECDEVRSVTTGATHLKMLDNITTASAEYQKAMSGLASDWRDRDRINQERMKLGSDMSGISQTASANGLKDATEQTQRSTETLATASFSVYTGLAVAVLVGVVLGGLIIRGISRVLCLVINRLNDNSARVADSAAPVLASSQALAEGASEQAASLEETSASLEEMSSMVQRNSDNAQNAKVLAQQTRGAADSGATDMQEMTQAMNDIKASSDKISKIIKTIDEISFQTNILALNAAVEAARAGEAGMGFAVVADEVRSLAQRCAQAAKETASNIEECISKSERGVQISAKVEQSLQEILAKARQVDELIAEIATASNEQSQGISQVNTAVSQMDKVTQANAATAEETASAAAELDAQAGSMRDAVGELMKLGGSSLTTAAASAVAPRRESKPQAIRTANGKTRGPARAALTVSERPR